MCLTTKQICPLKAKKDIVCYKTFVIDPDRQGLIITPWQKMRVQDPEFVGHIVTMEPYYRSSVPRRPSVNYGNHYYDINEGMIHAYSSDIRKKTVFWINCLAILLWIISKRI